MRYDGVITLITLAISRNAEGIDAETETARADVYAQLDAVGYREFYAAQQAGITPEITATIFEADYERQRVAIVDGVRYRVVRTYKRGDKVELTLEALEERGAG